MNNTRYLEKRISEDLARKKMILIGGPRQCGKTTLAKRFISNSGQYLNWDDLSDRDQIKTHQISPHLGTVVFDEIHKYARWRTLLKGLYDKHGDHLRILVTGSAKLDHFRKGGDSMFGRFFYYRLHPFTLPELDSKKTRQTTEQLLRVGGFPEPYLTNEEVFYKRWKRERKNRIISQDIRDLSTVRDTSLIELLADALPSRVGSVLSIKSLQEDLEVSPNTVSNWIALLESIYYCYRILPYGSDKIRAVKKSQKLYLWDWAEIESPGARFENLVASHLLKFCHYTEDTQGDQMELRFLRDTSLREIDFVVIKNKKPLFAVECKSGEKQISKHIRYYQERTPIPRYYQIHLGTREYNENNCWLLPFERFCEMENLI